MASILWLIWSVSKEPEAVGEELMKFSGTRDRLPTISPRRDEIELANSSPD